MIERGIVSKVISSSLRSFSRNVVGNFAFLVDRRNVVETLRFTLGGGTGRKNFGRAQYTSDMRVATT